MTDPADKDRTPFDWEARFRQNDTPWERSGLHPAFHDWAKAGLFKPGLRVFIPGCGRAPEPEAFARLGLEVTGLDVSESAIAWQRQRFAEAGLEGRFLVEDALAWRPQTPFDLYYEQTFLCAIAPRQRETYEQAAFEQLRPGGLLLALFMQNAERGGPPYGCGLDVMTALFPATRWIWPQAEPVAWPHPSLGGKAELAAVLERRAQAGES